MRAPLVAVGLLLCLGVCAPAAAVADVACPNEALRVERSSRLPDCRAYELVTPPYKEGAPVQGLQGEFAVSPDGTRLIGSSQGIFAGAEEGGSFGSLLEGTAYELSRTVAGWQATALGPPQSRYVDAGMYDASADLQRTLWGLGTLTQPEGVSDLYIEQPRGTFTEVGPFTPTSDLANAGRYSYLGASADLSHVLFSTQPGYRWPFDQTVGGASTLYEYAGTANAAPLLVGVSGGAGSTELVSRCGTLLGSSGIDGGDSGSVYNAISASGARVFFTAIGSDDEECGASQPPVDELLAREEGSSGAGERRTVAISEPAHEDCSACIAAPPGGVQDAIFQGASRDGSEVFFTSAQKLLPEAGEGTMNLYEYDFQAPAGEKLMLVSSGISSGTVAEVQGVARVSEDGSHVYFVATGVLDPAANSIGAVAVPGQDNLYVYERDSQFPGGRASFVATLSPTDAADWGRDDRPVLASAAGRYLVFSSQADLLREGLASGVAQVFQYDAQTGALVRASIGQGDFDDDGRTPLYSATIPTQQADAFDSPTTAAGMVAPEDGAVFFASANALTPQALDNLTDTLGEAEPNIYEYRAGSVHLISDGRDDSALDSAPGVQLLGSDPSGGDVFFTTVNSLLPQDTDTQQDIYDARVEGGFPAPVPPSSCFGEACQGPPSPPPPLTLAADGPMGSSADPAAPFGIADFGIQALDAHAAPETQAGGHPESLTTSFDFTTTGAGASERPSEDVKDVVLGLPPGLIVDAQAAPRCTLVQLQLTVAETACPASSRVGTLELGLSGSGGQAGEPISVYNVVPEAGYSLEFGASYLGHPILLYGNVVRTESGYGWRLAVPGVASLGVIGVSLTLFGNPGQRDGGVDSQVPLLTDPSDCVGGPLPATLEVDTWQDPGQYDTAEADVYSNLTGCDALRFEPTLDVRPETTQADDPAGYELQIRLPQVQAPSIPATPELKQAIITLPAGVSLSPAAADGLVACAATGPEGINIGSDDTGSAGQDLGDPEASELGPDGLYHPAPGRCPRAATVGTVEINTPLLDGPLAGHVYLAQQGCGGEGQPPCTEADAADGRLVGLYLEAAGAGIVLKLFGRVSLNPATGQMTMRFEELPQLPLSDLKLHLKGGPRAPLVNPQTCGEATASSDLSPWSSPVTLDAEPMSAFDVDWDGRGGACPEPLPFEPSFSATAATPAAGSFTPLALRISREARQQYLSRLSVQLPPGLAWMFAGVPLCEEPQAAAGVCASASEIGKTEVAMGAGPDPLWLPGRVYLTAGYRGAPYGLSIAVRMLAGPFNLGTVIVRAALGVEAGTGALTISSDPFPQIIDGIPLRIQTVAVSIDRPEFVLNPTICASRPVIATIEGAGGTSVEASSPFETPGCVNPPPATSGAAAGGGGVIATAVHKPPKKAAKPKPKRKKKRRRRSVKHRGKHSAKAKKGKRGSSKRK